MTQDPVTKLALEVTRGYPPEFNLRAVEVLIEQAWQMGLNVVSDPGGPEKLNQAHLWRASQYRNADEPDGDV